MQNFKPTWLYIKQHNTTGLKYFGKTTGKNPEKYLGSGARWQLHLKKHGKDITTVWKQLFEDASSLTAYALEFSSKNNIVQSAEWANLMVENGLDGGQTRENLSDETVHKMAMAKKGKTLSADVRKSISEAHKGALNPFYGKQHSAATKEKISAALVGRVPSKGTTGLKLSAETKQKMSAAAMGKPKGPFTATHKQNLSKPKATTICPHCSKVGGSNAMSRYHFDNCKLALNITNIESNE
jgi:hypothetical protein